MSKKRNNRLPAGISQLADGRYKIRWTHVNPLTKRRKDHVRTLPHGTTMGQALDALDAERSAQQSQAIEVQNPSLETYAKSWLVAKADNGCAPSTLDTFAYQLGHILVAIGHHKVDKIERAHLRAWRKDLESLVSKDTYSLATVCGWWSVALMLVGDAKAEFGLPQVSERLKAPKGILRPRREQRTLLPDEALRIMGYARGRYAPLFAVCMFTGIRRGEAIALLWEDVHFDSQVIVVRRSATYSKASGWTVKPPKNGKPRIASMHSQLVTTLKDWRQEMLTTQDVGLASGLVCPSPDGGFATYGGIRRCFSSAKKRSGCDQQITPQVLRRTLNTLALSVADRVVVQASLGHMDDSMSAQYLGLRTETIAPLADKAFGG